MLGSWIKRKELNYRNMPVKINISISPETYEAALKLVESGDYRNVSHFFEQAGKKLARKKLAEKSENPCEASV
jgi:Arc/MetJ-type ribon-helix-helix transcriptional regulator